MEIVKELSDPSDRVRLLRSVDQVQGDQGDERELLFDIGIAEESVGVTTEFSLPRLPSELPQGIRYAHLDVFIVESNLLCVGLSAVKEHIRKVKNS